MTSTIVIVSCSKAFLENEDENNKEKLARMEVIPPQCQYLNDPCTDPECAPYFDCPAPLFTDPIKSNEIGPLHNQILTGIDAKFVEDGINPETITSWTIADNYSKNYAEEFFQENYATSITQVDIANAVVKRNTMFGITPTSVLNTNLLDFKIMADSLLNLPNSGLYMTTAEKQIVSTLFLYLEQFHDSIINRATLDTKISDAETAWNNQGFNANLNQGFISGCAINVAKFSAIHWANYQGGTFARGTSAGATTKIAAAWVAADAVGALAGAIGSAVEGGSWGSIGRQALVWGVFSSIPSTRWFKRLKF